MIAPALMLLAAAATWLVVPGAGLARLDDGRTHNATRTRPGEPYPRLWRAAAGIGVAALCVFLLPDMPLVGLACGGVAFALTGWLRRHVSHRQELEQMPDALDFLAVCFESGAPTPTALATVADVSPPRTQSLLRRVLAHLHVGRAPEQAWQELAAHPVWGVVAKDMVRASRSGTSLAGSLRLHADDARIQARDAAMKRARKVGVKSVVPLMACFLPAFVLIGVVPIIASLLKNFFT